MYLVLILVAIWLAHHYWTRRRMIYFAYKLNGPNGLPIIGSAYKLLNPDTTMQVIKEVQDQAGTLGKFWLGGRLFVNIVEPEHMEKVLNDPNCLNKGDSYDFLLDLLGEGLVTMKGEGWKMHRKNINPCFSAGIINSYFPMINKAAKVFVNTTNQHIDEKTINLRNNLGAMSLDMITETTIGYEMNTQTGHNLEVFHAVHTMTKTIGLRLFSLWMQSDICFRLSSYYNEYKKSVKIIQDVVNKVIQNKRKDYELARGVTDDTSKIDDYDGTITASKNAFIQRLFKLSLDDKIFSADEMFNELKTMLIAGYETTYTTAYAMLVLLAMHPQFQDKLYAEICEILPNANHIIKNDDLNKLTYLDMIVKEALRLIPSVPYLSRIAGKEMVIDNKTIPAGAEFFMDILRIHKNQKYWKFNAEEFNPENFAPENLIPKHSYAYMPFGGGPHKCIGHKYAYIATRIFLIYAVRNFRFSSDLKLSEIAFKMSVTLNIINEDIIKIEKRSPYPKSD